MPFSFLPEAQKIKTALWRDMEGREEVEEGSSVEYRAEAKHAHIAAC